MRAPKAVLVFNAYSGQFPFLRKYLEPAPTYAIATAPLHESTAATLGPPANEEILIYNYPPHYYQRLRRDRRLVFGGGNRNCRLAPAPGRAHSESVTARSTRLVGRTPLLIGNQGTLLAVRRCQSSVRCWCAATSGHTDRPTILQSPAPR